MDELIESCEHRVALLPKKWIVTLQKVFFLQILAKQLKKTKDSNLIHLCKYVSQLTTNFLGIEWAIITLKDLQETNYHCSQLFAFSPEFRRYFIK